MVLSNPGTQYMSLSAGIAQEPVSMTPKLTVETFCFAPAQTLASPSTVRWSSAVDSTIELACTGVAHKARAALSGLSGRRHGRWCRIRAPSSARTSEPSDLFDPSVTQMCHIFTQRAWHESQRQGASPRRADLHDRMRLEHMRLDHTDKGYMV